MRYQIGPQSYDGKVRDDSEESEFLRGAAIRARDLSERLRKDMQVDPKILQEEFTI